MQKILNCCCLLFLLSPLELFSETRDAVVFCGKVLEYEARLEATDDEFFSFTLDGHQVLVGVLTGPSGNMRFTIHRSRMSAVDTIQNTPDFRAVSWEMIAAAIIASVHDSLIHDKLLVVRGYITQSQAGGANVSSGPFVERVKMVAKCPGPQILEGPPGDLIEPPRKKLDIPRP